MLPYFAVAGMSAVLSWINSATIKTINNRRRVRSATEKFTNWFVIDFIVILILVAFSAVRFEVGTDFETYIRSYEMLTDDNWAEQIAASPQEFGYVILALCVKKFSEGPALLLWVTSAITVIPAYLAIKKNSKNATMSVILFVLLAFYVTPFNVIRQGMAISLNFWANTFIDKNRKVFIALNLVAASIHITALYATIIQYVFHRRKLGSISFLTICSVTALALAFPQLWSWIIELSDQTSDRYDGYLELNPAGVGTFVLIAARLFLIIYALLLGNSENSGRYALYCMIGIAFLVLGTQSLVISRMSDYFSIYLLFLIPNQLDGRRDAYLHALLIYLIGVIYFWQHLGNWGNLIPYQMSFFP